MGHVDLSIRDEYGTALDPETGLPYLWSYWEGETPCLIKMCLDTLREHNPSFRLVTPESLPSLQGSHLLELTSGLRPQQRSDLVRLWLVDTYGGMWVDADTLALRPLDLLTVVQRYDLVGIHNRHQMKGFGREMIGSPFGGRAGSPLIRRGLNLCQGAIRRLREGHAVPYGATSAGLLGRLWRSRGDAKALRLEHWKYYAVPWYRAEKVYRRGAPFERHEKSPAWNPNAELYHLSNQTVRAFTGWCRQRILNSRTFLGFLFHQSYGTPGKAISDEVAALLDRFQDDIPLEGAEVGVGGWRNARQLLQRRPRLLLRASRLDSTPRTAETTAERDTLLGEGKKALRFAEDRAKIHVGRLSDAVKGVPDLSLDFVFFGGCPPGEEYSAAIEAWLPKIKDGGYLGGVGHEDDSGVSGIIGSIGKRSGSSVEHGGGGTWFCRVQRSKRMRTPLSSDRPDGEGALTPGQAENLSSADLSGILERCGSTGQYMVAAFYVEQGRLTLVRRTASFPVDDFPVALEMLSADLQRETGRIHESK